MSFIVVFHRLAVRDYLEGRRWYARRSPAAAIGFQRSLDQAIDRIRQAPQFGTPCEHDCLWIKLKKYPYILRYRIE